MPLAPPRPLPGWSSSSTLYPVLFGSAEVCQRLRLTARQLQWWDEQGLLPARHAGHKRLYSLREAVLAGVIGQLRQAGLGSARLQTALCTITGKGRGEELPRYLVVNWHSGRSYAAATDGQALEIVSRLGDGGAPSLLIDLEQIENKLASAGF
jgi:MerR HTH family regulatory protein